MTCNVFGGTLSLYTTTANHYHHHHHHRHHETLRDTPPIHWSGCSSLTQIREYVNTRRTIHPPIHSWWSSVPCGCCTCLEFLATQCVQSTSSLASFCLHLKTHLFAASFPRWHSTPSYNLVSVQCPYDSITFPVAATRAWNSLPSFVRDKQSLADFQHQLKTVLFRTSFGEDANTLAASLSTRDCFSVC